MSGAKPTPGPWNDELVEALKLARRYVELELSISSDQREFDVLVKMDDALAKATKGNTRDKNVRDELVEALSRICTAAAKSGLDELFIEIKNAKTVLTKVTKGDTDV